MTKQEDFNPLEYVIDRLENADRHQLGTYGIQFGKVWISDPYIPKGYRIEISARLVED